jgi:hypothetical protein
MSFKTLFFLIPVSWLALTGCKTSCTGLCDDAKDADCATTSTQTINGVEVPKSTFDHAQCYATCQREQDMEDDDVKDCQDEWNNFLDCARSQDDICKVWEIDDFSVNTDSNGNVAVDVHYRKCSSEWNDYESCVNDFCADHTKRDYCNAQPMPPGAGS